MQNYNYSLELNYKNDDNDTLFRKELLDCFNLEQYDDKINELIYNLYLEVQSHYSEIIQQLKNNNNICSLFQLEKRDCFKLLFSWDHLYYNHLLLKSINTNNKTDIEKNKKVLLKNIG
jgi:hypothetical protein